MSEITGNESKQSITVQFYYKGFSILLTKRDLGVRTMPLLEDAMKAIDWAIEHNLQPSWNPDTNKAAALPTQKTMYTDFSSNIDNLGICNKCGAKKILSKKGNIVCSKYCWLK